MLSGHDAVATVAVRDLKAASRFYEDMLGLERIHDEESQAYTYRTGGSTMLVYQSEYAGTNRATAVTWMVGDRVDALVESLKAKGVRFERYDMPETRHDGDVHVAGETRVAWFKDPDGNIHALVNG
ncbi:MAG TPA: VOC family protein [Longimicrobiales bacterium]|nr:VOC family protein [Longimicrobiales bacterium]